MLSSTVPAFSRAETPDGRTAATVGLADSPPRQHWEAVVQACSWRPFTCFAKPHLEGSFLSVSLSKIDLSQWPVLGESHVSIAWNLDLTEAEGLRLLQKTKPWFGYVEVQLAPYGDCKWKLLSCELRAACELLLHEVMGEYEPSINDNEFHISWRINL